MQLSKTSVHPYDSLENGMDPGKTSQEESIAELCLAGSVGGQATKK